MPTHMIAPPPAPPLPQSLCWLDVARCLGALCSELLRRFQAPDARVLLGPPCSQLLRLAAEMAAGEQAGHDTGPCWGLGGALELRREAAGGGELHAQDPGPDSALAHVRRYSRAEVVRVRKELDNVRRWEGDGVACGSPGGAPLAPPCSSACKPDGRLAT